MGGYVSGIFSGHARAAAIVMPVVAILAGYVPFRRASRMDALVALHYE